MRRFLLSALIVLAAASGARAASDPKGKGVEVSPMPFLVVPMSKDGKLLGYAYVGERLTAASPAAAIQVRAKLAFIQDAFVRDVNGAPVGQAGDPTKVDTARLNARLTADARRIMGADKIVGMTFTAIQFTPLHPDGSTLDMVPPEERLLLDPSGTAQPPAPQVQPANPPAAAPAATSPVSAATQ